MAKSILSRKRDLMYLVYFIIHVPIMFCKLGPFSFLSTVSQQYCPYIHKIVGYDFWLCLTQRLSLEDLLINIYSINPSSLLLLISNSIELYPVSISKL
jgi:hypothetical protein